MLHRPSNLNDIKQTSAIGGSYRRLLHAPLAAGAALMLWLLPVLSGCNTSGCTDNHNALPLMGFYSSADEKKIALDSVDIGGIGAPRDSLLVEAGHAVEQLYLPFRYNNESTSFFIHYAYRQQGLDSDEFNDTITFRYTAAPYFASEECGAMIRYDIHSVEYTRHLIDSIAVTDSVITNVERERFMVFIRTAGSEQSARQATEKAPWRGLRP